MDESREQLNNQIFSWLSHSSNLDPTSTPLDNLDSSWEVESIDPSSGEEDFDMLQPNPNNTSELRLLVVQHRFEDLLKQRLQSERADDLPLFPWETEINEYLADREEKPQSSWQRQLSNLPIPIPIPENILASIFKQCSESILSLQPQGSKIVQALSHLFPDQSVALNQVTGKLLMSPSRSQQGTLEKEIIQRWQGEYETATPAQQLVISVIIAKKIVEALTITISPQQPQIERKWETLVGEITITAIYYRDFINVILNLPKKGTLTWQTTEVAETLECSEAGILKVDLPFALTYALTITLDDSEQVPLNFSLEIKSETYD